MLIILMYHQIYQTNQPTQNVAFAQHLQLLKTNYHLVVPGMPLHPNKLNIALSFDDAYFDFYYYVFPLLKQLQIPAILGIPTNLIAITSNVAPATRLAVAYPNGLLPQAQQHTPLCTWAELREMVASGLVYPAAHGHNHVNFCAPNTDLISECKLAKDLLTQQLNCEIDTLIFPFGKTNKQVNIFAKKYFKYLLRIGAAGNTDWTANNGLLYRINADPFWQHSPNTKFNKIFLSKAMLHYWGNKLRGR